ncbi:MAG: hypothetical protein JW709_00410 [Sedimentisphaerales bacterium]|nr:hypothetical protein [Sedimentisphaerales bacterium]
MDFRGRLGAKENNLMATKPTQPPTQPLAAPEVLLDIKETSRRLGISRRKFGCLRARLIAQGLQEVAVGRQKKYRQVSLDQLIRQAAERNLSLG